MPRATLRHSASCAIPSDSRPEYNVKYIWIDTEYWTPSKYWTEDGHPVNPTYFEQQQIDTSDATVTEDDILSGKTAYARGEKLTGVLDSAMNTIDYIKALETAEEIKGVG